MYWNLSAATKYFVDALSVLNSPDLFKKLINFRIMHNALETTYQPRVPEVLVR